MDKLLIIGTLQAIALTLKNNRWDINTKEEDLLNIVEFIEGALKRLHD